MSTETPKQKLISYINSAKIVLNKCKKGVMIWDTSKVTNLQHLTQLVEDCDWIVSELPKSFHPTTGAVQGGGIWLGPRKVTSAEDALADM